MINDIWTFSLSKFISLQLLLKDNLIENYALVLDAMLYAVYV